MVLSLFYFTQRSTFCCSFDLFLLAIKGLIPGPVLLGMVDGVCLCTGGNQCILVLSPDLSVAREGQLRIQVMDVMQMLIVSSGWIERNTRN